MENAPRVDMQKLLRAGLLVAWTSFFVWLWVTGERARYLGPRTYWVIPFGVAFLGGAALVHLLTLRTRRSKPISTGDLARTGLLLVPLLAVIVVPSPDLGALAASRKATAVGLAASGAPSIEGVEHVEDPSFIDIHHANQSRRYGEALGVTVGTEVDLVGFVTHDSELAVEGTQFTLTRFYVSCCAADAIPYSVAVDGGSTDYPDERWLSVRGALEERAGRLVVVAEGGVRPVTEPEDPYLY
jgi:putative membrane protein